jgi:hypothetical protein
MRSPVSIGSVVGLRGSPCPPHTSRQPPQLKGSARPRGWGRALPAFVGVTVARTTGPAIHSCAPSTCAGDPVPAVAAGPRRLFDERPAARERAQQRDACEGSVRVAGPGCKTAPLRGGWVQGRKVPGAPPRMSFGAGQQILPIGDRPWHRV